VKEQALTENRLPSLDGFRAVSILAVLFSHLAGTRHAYPVQAFMGPLATLGVHIFYVLSGFLITHLLLGEQMRTGAISLRGFYLRRVFRIFPVFYAFLIAMAVLRAVGFLKLFWGDLLIAGGFMADFGGTDWNVQHFWSLSSEEQFYFLWPALLVFAGRRRAVNFALAAMLSTPLASGFLWKLQLPHLATFLLSVNAIATGCILAGVRPRLHACPAYLRFLGSKCMMALPFLTLLLNYFRGHGAVLLYGVTALCIAVLIDWSITLRSGFATCLNWKPVAFVGAISYSLYVWQQIFLNRYLDRPYTAFPLNMVLAVACALASFYAIERPFLALRRRRKRVPKTAQVVASS
jgi:peptidoglycan/LPS O-acetylase OafA/YrhL